MEKSVEMMGQQIEKLEKTMKDGFLAISKELKEFREEVKEGDKSFVSIEKFEERVSDIHKEQLEIKKIATTRSWLMAAAGAFLTLILTVLAGLLVFFFTHYKKGV